MPCKLYKDELIEAAASGAEPRGDLRTHLAECADCRIAFEQERSLFASIDAGLHVTANAKVPLSLLPRVRARLDEESAPRRSWAANWLVLASAAVIVVALFAAHAVWRTNGVPLPIVTAVRTTVPPHVTAPPENHDHAIESPAEKNPGSRQQLVIAKNPAAPESPAKGNTMPEVLVPRDQEILLTAYAEQWRLRKHPLLVAQDFDATILAPLQVAPIQIDELGVKLLADEKLQ